MSDDTPIFRLLESLPQSSLTTRVLSALDYLVPGEWQNITNFEQMIRTVTGEEDQGIVQQVGERAITLYASTGETYQRSVWLFQTADSLDKLAGAAAFASKVGEKFSLLSFLEKITPKADTTQAIDAGVKFVAEMAAFCYTSGLPGDSVGDFVGALVNYGKEDIMRFAAWIALDGILPLGPDFLGKVIDTIQRISTDELGENGRFRAVAQFLPGSSVDDHRSLIHRSLSESSGFIQNFVSSKGLSRESLLESIKGYVDTADQSLDYIAAALDVSTNYFEHTGIQTVARRLVSRAYGEI